MSTDLAANDLLRTTMWWTETAQAASVTLNWRILTVGGSPLTDFDFAGQVGSVVAAQLLAVQAPTVTFKGTQAQITRGTTKKVDVLSVSGAGPGTAGSVVLPKQVTGLVSWYTLITGRHGRGRSYIPWPPTERVTADGVPDATYQAHLNSWATAILNTTSVTISGRTATMHLAILERRVLLATDVSSYTIRSVFATQHRRGDYGRPNSSPF